MAGAPRGRKTIETVAALARATAMLARPDAPYDLSDEAADEWRAVVNRLPADWFPRETHAMLAQYCRHVVAARRCSQLIAKTENAKTLDVELYDRLLKMQEREGRAISSLATRMRLSQQATTSADKTKGRRGPTPAPWEAG
jgi:hypothetical protein